jgi:hypothetical protein
MMGSYYFCSLLGLYLRKMNTWKFAKGNKANHPKFYN